MNTSLSQFEKQQYLCIETFRKNGQGVRTPVWFARDGDDLFVWTESSSGKVKRIRNTPKVNVVPSKGDGTPVGEWAEANATIDSSPASIQRVRNMFIQKYGLVYHAFGFLGKLRRAEYTTVKLQVTGG